MKTIKKGKDIERVTNKKADQMVDSGWNFCSKSEWKKNVRDFSKKEIKEKVIKEKTVKEK